MTAQMLDGEVVAAQVRAEVAGRVAELVERHGVRPGLGTVLVGDDPPSARYVAMKHADCAEVGIASAHEHLPADATQAQVDEVVDRFNADPAVHAYLLQHPFPAGLDYAAALARVDPDQDVDGLHPVQPRPPGHGRARAPALHARSASRLLLEHHGIELAGRHVVIVGRGLTIGRPLANLLALKEAGANAAVTVVHTGVADLAAYTRQADVLVAAAGSAGPDHGRARAAGSGRGGGGGSLRGPQAAVRRRPGCGRGGRLADPPHRRRRADDPGHAAAQLPGRRRAPGRGRPPGAAHRAGLSRKDRWGRAALHARVVPMAHIRDLLAAGRTFSFEFFPPKTDEALRGLEKTLHELEGLRPSFVSVTYGAGGSTRDRTRDLVVDINRTRPFPAMAHLTCMAHRREQLVELLEDYAANGVDNILALAGDPPADGSPAEGDFRYATELVELVRQVGDFSVGVAAHPELHPRSESTRDDRRRLADKLAVADFGITQFFFDPVPYLRMRDDLAALGCDTPVLPGRHPRRQPGVGPAVRRR